MQTTKQAVVPTCNYKSLAGYLVIQHNDTRWSDKSYKLPIVYRDGLAIQINAPHCTQGLRKQVSAQTDHSLW